MAQHERPQGEDKEGRGHVSRRGLLTGAMIGAAALFVVACREGDDDDDGGGDDDDD